MEATPDLQKYASQSIRYLENALKSIAQSDFDKASEFLWGSIAEALKAVAAKKGLTLRTHGELWDYARGLAKELGDRSIYDGFFKANSLHSNFYESKLSPQDVVAVAESVRDTVGKLLKLAGYEAESSLGSSY